MLKQYPIINLERHPVAAWHQGELVAGIYNFPLPAGLKPGKYRLETGMWVPPDGPGAAVRPHTSTDGAEGQTTVLPDRVVLAEVEVR
jgi:hypothetical protein